MASRDEGTGTRDATQHCSNARRSECPVPTQDETRGDARRALQMRAEAVLEG